LPNIEQKVGKIRKVLHFENEIEHKILVTYVIAKVSNCHSHAGGNLVCSVSVISDKFLLLFISRFPLSWE
ncbi:hypothetical protein M5014_11125, partial [Neisseria meningitidis]|nr:hypothetical protein [Neisseria meningitidis]MCL4989542.1 hypothetical protein [Neisseria meningitidis]MCL4991542.1 hypothetical protein [Neisseria meningitidis]MCL4995545.1 hypothetical protein [Neisseria meningitidis]MCL5683487.1 hypothetical protein [Neisseria meningitidis]